MLALNNLSSKLNKTPKLSLIKGGLDCLDHTPEVKKNLKVLPKTIADQKISTTELLSSIDYTYNDVGLRSSKTETLGVINPSSSLKSLNRTSTYTYDDLNRLTSSTSPTENFTYDSVGNRDFATGTNYNVLNQITTDGYKYDFTYNDNGDLIEKENLKTNQVTEYEWDARSQLTKIKLIDNATSTLKKEIAYKYDGLGRRTQKTVTDYLNPNKSYTRRYYYHQNQIIEERNENGQTVANYMQGPGIDDPILMERNNKAYVYTKDGLGSIKELTDMDGKAVQRYRYSAYGLTTQELAINNNEKELIESPYGYTGRELEKETGLYYYRARYYDPELGRFISKDPILFAGGDTNLYNYVMNDPINFIDPSGLYAEVTIWQPVGWGSSSFGHVSANINGTAYSFGPGGLWSGPTSEYIRKNTDFRSGVGLQLDLTPSQESAFEQSIKNNQNGYSTFGNNCSDVIEQGLGAAGVDVGNPLFPTSLGNTLLNVPQFGGVRMYYPVNGSNSGSAPWAK